MFSVVINEKGGSPRSMDFDKPEVTIGRVQGNDIILPKGNISKRHSRVVLKDGKFIIVDLKSTNGTYVNGRKISSPHILKEADKIYIGDFTLTVEQQSGKAESPPPPARKPATRKPPPPPEEDVEEEIIAPAEDYGDLDDGEFVDEFVPEPEPMPEPEPEPEPDLEDDFEEMPEPPPPPPPPSREPKIAPRRVKGRKLPARHPKGGPPPRRTPEPSGIAAAQASALAALLQKSALDELSGADAESAAKAAVDAADIGVGVDKNEVLSRLLSEIVGLGPLDALLADEAITRIFVNSPDSVFVENNGEVVPHNVCFSGSESMVHVTRKLLTNSRVPFDEDSPIIDTRLADGTHMSALLPPIGARGPVLALCKPVNPTSTLEKLVEAEVLSEGMAEFLETCITHRKNIVVSANYNSDGTALLRAIANNISDSERVVTVEEVAQLNLQQPNVVSLEAAPTHNGGIILRDLVRTALRLAPERLVVGDCRGGEAIDILQAMGGALDGSALLVHGHTTRDCISRLEAMMLMGGVDATAKALREAIATAVEVIVQITRFADGAPRVTQIAVVSGMEVDLVTMQDIFVFQSEGMDKNGNALGSFMATGVVPRFYEELQHRGERVNMGVFREGG